MSQELTKSFGAWGQPVPASLLLHAEGTQGCLYTARPLQPRGMEKQNVTPIERRDRQVVKRTAVCVAVTAEVPLSWHPVGLWGKDRTIWGRHRGSPAASARTWARGGREKGWKERSQLGLAGHPGEMGSAPKGAKEGIGFQEQALGVDTQGVEEGDEVLSAEESVSQGEGECGGDEAPAVLHHPGACAPLH